MMLIQPGTVQLTECLNICRQNSSCLAINFETGFCVLLQESADRNPQALQKSQFPIFTIYAHKICLQGKFETWNVKFHILNSNLKRELRQTADTFGRGATGQKWPQTFTTTTEKKLDLAWSNFCLIRTRTRTQTFHDFPIRESYINWN